MPRAGITAYDLLLSCPSDVLDCLDAIKNSVDNFNKVFGAINNIEITIRHWSTDSYPQSGDKPQELLNKQLVRNCDAAVAIFWTRFGSPTDKYGSGTEEEIEEMIAAGKQVFMYFLDKEISLSEVDLDQYTKVKEFKEKYKDKGIYFVVKNEQELQQQFTNHLGLYFLSVITENSNAPIAKTQMPVLKIRDSSTFADDSFEVYQFSLCESKYISKKLTAIIGKIESIQNNELPARLPKKVESNVELTEIQKSLQKIRLPELNQFGTSVDAEISDIVKKAITEFSQKNGINLGSDFWNVGELKKRESMVALPFAGGGTTYEGTEEEKNRYNLIKEIYWNINEYNAYIKYFSELDNKKYLECVISNIGTTFDEDIDVKLFIEKGYICDTNSIPIPDINIIEEVIQNDLIKCLFTISENEKIDSYSGYFPMPQDYSDLISSSDIFFNEENVKEKYNINKRKYKNGINNIFCYKVFESANDKVLCFHIQYLKHNTNMAFPSILLFNRVPTCIKYEISSKHISEIVKGEIGLK